MEIIEYIFDKEGRYKEFRLIKSNNLMGRKAMEVVYNTLLNDDIFRNFGHYKVIITTASFNNEIGERSYHPNVLITNNLSFETFYKKIEDYVTPLYEDFGYINEYPKFFIVKV